MEAPLSFLSYHSAPAAAAQTSSGPGHVSGANRARSRAGVSQHHPCSLQQSFARAGSGSPAKSPAWGNAACPALTSWEQASAREQLLHVKLGGLQGGRDVFKVPLLTSQGCVAVRPPASPQAPAGLRQGMRPSQRCHLRIPMVTFGKRGWMGSWISSPGRDHSQDRQQGPQGPCRHPQPRFCSCSTHRYVTRLRGPEMESSKCYI